MSAGQRFFRRFSLVKSTVITDWSVYILPILLSLFGLSILYSFQPRSALLIDQLVFIGLGVTAMVVVTFFDYRNLKSISWPFYCATLIGLIAVLSVGESIYGSRRWIEFGLFQFQPAELVKVSMILVYGLLLPKLADRQRFFKIGLLIILATGLPIWLILRQPDFGTASVIGVIILINLAHVKLPRFLWSMLLIAGLVVSPILYVNLRPYQRERLISFFNPRADPTRAGYNVIQSMIAIGSGGIWGRGLGQGPQSQLQFLPVVHTDFIFASIAEAFGFLGSGILVLVYIMLVWRATSLSMIAQDDFGQIIALSIAAMWFYQGLTNIGMNLGIMPVTGVPLPFVSYGGTATITNYFCAGLLQSIYLRHKKIRFS